MNGASSPITAENIYLNQCKVLESRYPALTDLNLRPRHKTAAYVFNIYCWHVRRMDAAAGAVDSIKSLEKWIQESDDDDIRHTLQRKLLSLQAARGLAHKVVPFLHPDDPLNDEIRRLQDEHALHYGADLRQFDMKGAQRGASVGHYFLNHPHLLKGKRVLHFAPEQDLRPWMVQAAERIGFTYFTADGFVKDVNYSVDLCNLSLPDEAFDLIINHRVLEHVIDDLSALREMNRVLRPGGILNISVPEALYLPRTWDWRVPDPRVHSHFRVYGRDFPMLLMKAGFTPERCTWLLNRPAAELSAANAYPMLFYMAAKT